MPNSYFRFKQFTVYHDKCAMKVGTDAALLGATAGKASPKSILDIGTGSGIIALMLAQRFPDAQISAIDIDNQAIEQAKENFLDSPWGNQLQAIQLPLADFFETNTQKFDLMVSNPPYFSNRHFAGSEARTLARHAIPSFWDDLFRLSRYHLHENGELALILPANSMQHTIDLASSYHWNLFQKTLIYSFAGDEPVRVMLSFQLKKEECKEETIVIYESEKTYTNQFKELMQSFYLYL